MFKPRLLLAWASLTGQAAATLTGPAAATLTHAHTAGRAMALAATPARY